MPSPRKSQPKAAKPPQPKAPLKRVPGPGAPAGVDVGGLLWDGIEQGIEDGLHVEEAKRGKMRGASQGLFLDMETITGPCHRAALARMLGGEPDRPADWTSKHLMFDSGHANEDSWVKNLERSWCIDADHIILREEEFPVSWHIETDAGAVAEGSGRADIVLAVLAEPGAEGSTKIPDGRTVIAIQGIELKQVSSINTAMDCLFPDGKPKLEHGIQAGRYMKQLGIPWQIWYTLPFVLPIPSWSFIQSKLPAKGSCDFIDYSKRGEPTKVQPTAVGYHLAFHGGRLLYLRVGQEQLGWVETIITEEGLDDFWKFTLDMPGFRDLGPRPQVLDILGSKGHYSACDYCDWRPICDAHENDYDEWESAVKGMIPDLGEQEEK